MIGRHRQTLNKEEIDRDENGDHSVMAAGMLPTGYSYEICRRLNITNSVLCTYRMFSGPSDINNIKTLR